MSSNQQQAAPLVSIIVLYYKRREIIENTLRSALRQDYLNTEIIVVDNHSEDDLSSLVGTLDGRIRLIELPKNAGACAGRNAGIRVAGGSIFVFLDDDVCFASPFEVSKIVQAFERNREIHVLALQICDPQTGRVRQREWCHTRPYDFAEEEFETNWFGEGESAFWREVFDRCGMYYERLFYGAEGHDMVMRILDHGYRILHVPTIRVNHWASDTGRTVGRQYYYFTRNFIWMAYKDYRLWDGLRFAVPKMLMMVYFAWRTSAYGPVLKGMLDGVLGLPAIHRERTPVSRATVKYMAEQDRWRPGLMTRLARHKEQPQI